ncbi:hypothetical protein ACO2Q8_07890 [Larkinella sp. VNQ87]|uniref:hypothetical protein n=1 Tax=Larkinella sp. VNQ87 TaxID=3400921 RepID=UPI003C0C4EE5
MKLKLKITAPECTVLANALHVSIMARSNDPEHRFEIGEYCISSVLYDLYNKVSKKNNDLLYFGRPANRQTTLTMTRSEALAFYYLFVVVPENQHAVVLYASQSYEYAVLDNIIMQIHQAYLV